ncbi:hypothetical protein BOTBODRAFT_59509 [Botryobasidium botryosum FD-172 SS1]|uniref:Enoyl reductase (ER) domain-containing protein n=1 Tax=Botryobasidium botryosum (strain FD-172 SS1) TaxID=930990 RepID=A0A067LXP7_BOTB1|nr:hypothetical protein BOTBODRAFT_59509 [Botryobasidium botryosum FD-172 SS1]
MSTIASNLSKTFKAAQIDGPNQPWKIVDMPHRELKPTEVLIKVLASGICGSDHFVEDGSWPGIVYPRVAGHEVVGRVAALGSDVKPVAHLVIGALVGVGWNGGYCSVCEPCREGDFAGCVEMQVSGFTFDGGHAEYIYAPRSAVVSVPESATKYASYAEIAPMMCAGVTVYGALKASGYTPGDLCVIQGIGGLGHMAIQFAAKLGLRVYVVTTSPSKGELAKSLGAHGFFISSPNTVDEIQALGGAKLIICSAPYSKVISDLIPAVARNGTIMLVGATTDGKIQIDNVLFNMSRVTLKGWSCGVAKDAEECLNFAALTGVRSVVETYSLEEFSKAYGIVKTGNPKFRNVITFPE